MNEGAEIQDTTIDIAENLTHDVSAFRIIDSDDKIFLDFAIKKNDKYEPKARYVFNRDIFTSFLVTVSSFIEKLQSEGRGFEQFQVEKKESIDEEAKQ